MGFFRKTAFGIDVSDSGVKAIELKSKNSHAKVREYVSFDLPKGLIVNGVISNIDVLATEIKNGLLRNGKNIFSSVNCIFSLPEPLIYLDILEAEKTDSDLAEKVGTYVLSRFPFLPDKLTYDYNIIAENDEVSDVQIIAIQKDHINSYVDALTKAGLQPLLGEPQSMSNSRAVLDTNHCENISPTIIVDLGKSYSSCVVYDECGVRLSVSLKISGDMLTKEIVEKLGGPEKKAEILKKKYGLSLGVKGKSKKRVLQEMIDSVILSIHMIAERYETKTQRKIAEVLLLGKTSQLPYLKEYLAKKLLVKHKIISTYDVVEVKDSFMRAIKKDSAATAVGLALRSFNARYSDEINLIKK